MSILSGLVEAETLENHTSHSENFHAWWKNNRLGLFLVFNFYVWLFVALTITHG